ncbi:hypothetical protein ACJX0J_027949, partial [Zea mays]
YQPYTIHILLHKNFFIFIFGLSHGFLLEHFVILCCAYQCFCFHFSFSGLLKNIFQMSTICLFGFVNITISPADQCFLKLESELSIWYYFFYK